MQSMPTNRIETRLHLTWLHHQQNSNFITELQDICKKKFITIFHWIDIDYIENSQKITQVATNIGYVLKNKRNQNQKGKLKPTKQKEQNLSNIKRKRRDASAKSTSMIDLEVADRLERFVE